MNCFSLCDLGTVLDLSFSYFALALLARKSERERETQE